jgi:hypothetical protein
MSSYSNLKIELIGNGEQAGQWGDTTNLNLGTAIEEAIANTADVTFANAPIILTATNSNGSQAFRHARLNLIGVATTPQDLELPGVAKLYVINNTLASYITVKNAAGSSVVVPSSATMMVYNTGTNVVDAISYASAFSTINLTATGGTLSGVTGGFSSITDTGNLTFTGTANRIRGDFSNATESNRVAFQTSTSNSATNVNVLPSGSATIAAFAAANNADASNAGYLAVSSTSTVNVLDSGKTGTGTYLPLALYTSNTERMRVTPAGGVSFGATGTAYGTLGQVLTSQGNVSPIWQDLVVSIPIAIDGGGFAITTGVKFYLQIPFNCTITGWIMLADTTTSTVIDIWKDTYANFPPTVADTITGSAKPAITASNKNTSTTLTGWTTSINAGDILAFNVDSNNSATRINIALTAVKI